MTTQTTFVERYIEIIIGIGSGALGSGTPTYYTLTGYRVSASIKNYGGEAQGEAVVRIFGMSLNLMNQLTTIGPVMSQIYAANSIQILAGSNPDALTTVYSGTIISATANFNNSPDVVFEVTALSSGAAAVVAAQSTSYSKPVSVDRVMNSLANQLQLAYLNNGEKVTSIGTVDDPVTYAFSQPVTFNGSYLDQIKACAYAADIDYKIEHNTLSIKNRFSYYPSSDVPVVSPATGMVGYPVFNSQGCTVKSLFIPQALLGGQIQIQGSLIAAANKFWTLISVEHELESILSDGKWFTVMGAFPSDTNS